MALVSMFLCNQSYASHGRDFLLGATILNFNAAKYLKLRGLFLANKSKEASTCRREAAALTVRCLPRAQS